MVHCIIILLYYFFQPTVSTPKVKSLYLNQPIIIIIIIIIISRPWYFIPKGIWNNEGREKKSRTGCVSAGYVALPQQYCRTNIIGEADSIKTLDRNRKALKK